MSTNHTPGPWSWEYGDAECSRPIALSAPKYDVILASEDFDGPRVYVSDADARLIAAAPELLAALQGVLNVADRKTDEFDAARAAIAKATEGGQS